MAKLNDVKPKTAKITLSDGVEREMKFTLNAMAELEDRYGSIDAAFEALNNNSIKAVRLVLWAGLMHLDEGLTEQQVGKLIDIACLNRIMDDLNAAMEEDMPVEPGHTTDATPQAAALPNA